MIKRSSRIAGNAWAHPRHESESPQVRRSSIPATYRGGCLCGAIRYEITPNR
jgi:hypothetical protein